MSSLVVNKQYADPIPPNSAQLDAAFNSIETYLNITGLGADNIIDSSITTAKLSDSSVTETKIAALSVGTANIEDAAITLNKLSADLKKAFLDPVGTIDSHAGDTAPTGYLICDGAAVSRVTYVDLFGVVGIRFGTGNGTTTFNLPDLRGMFLRGADLSSGRDPQGALRTAMATGGAVGTDVGSVQLDDWKHAEGYITPTTAMNLVDVSHNTSSYIGVIDSTTPGYAPSTEGVLNGDIRMTSTDTSKHGIESRPVNALVTYIIKT